MGLLQQVTINTVYRVGFIVFQLLNTVLLSRLMGPAGFGIYSLVVVNANLLLVFSSLGIPAGILYHASAKDLALHRLLKILWLSTLAQMALALIIEGVHYSIQGSWWIWPSGNWIAGTAGLILFVAVVLTEKYYALYNGFNRFPLYNLITVIFNAILFLVLLGSWFTGGAELDSLIMIFIGIQLLQTITLVLIFHLRKLGDHPVIESAGVEKKFLNYSLYAFLANALYFLVTRVDFWILDHFKGETELGWYALSSRIGQMFLVLPGLFAGVILPSLTAGKMEVNRLESMLRILNSVNAAVMIVLALVLPWLMPFLFGARFGQSILPLWLLLPGIFFLAAQTLLASYFAAKGKPAVNFVSTLVAFSVVIILDLLLIPRWGARGAALASTIAYFAGTLYTYLQYIGLEKYPWTRLWMNREDLVHFSRLLRLP